MSKTKSILKFEEASCLIKDGSYTNISITNAAEIYNSKPKLFMESFASNLYCPECLQARLLYVNANPPYFRAYPNVKHDENCSKTQPPINQADFSDYCKDETNFEDINRRLKSVIRLLYKKRKNNDNPLILKIIKQEKTGSIVNVKEKTIKTVSIPRKLITVPLSKEDYDTYKLFYGNVAMRWKPVKFRYYLNVYTQEGGSLLCSINISNNVYEYLPKEYKTNHKKCYIAFAASMKKEGQFNNAVLVDSRLLVIEK